MESDSSSKSVQKPGQRAVRKRNGGPRSKSGCITCRIRHVKCDEERPACRRCTSTGRKCDGYTKSPWEVVDVPSMATMLVLSSDPRTSADPHAGRSFKVFERLTAGYLSGLFESSLWQDVLRASQHNNAIWHATTALGSAHEAYLHRKFDMQTLEEDRALQQYNKAIRMLTKPNALGEQPTPDVIMASSVLFMAFEMLRREYGKAIKHLRAGIGIFAEHHYTAIKQQSSTLISVQRLEDILRQLETHLCEICMEGPLEMPRRSFIGRKELPQDNVQWVFAPANLQLPGFATINEARIELDAYWHNLMFVLHEVSEPDIYATTLSPAEFSERCEAFIQAFASWRRRFDILLAQLSQRPEPLRSSERRALAQLEMYHLVGAQTLQTCLTPDEMNWDNYQHGFERVLDLCDVVTGTTADDGSTEEYGGFQLDNGIVAACFHIIWKCRSARVRVRAMKLLSHQRQEGLWDAQLVTSVGRHIDELERGPGLLEEAALRDDSPAVIPFWKRILGIDVFFSSEGREATIHFYMRKSLEEEDIITVKKCLSW